MKRELCYLYYNARRVDKLQLQITADVKCMVRVVVDVQFNVRTIAAESFQTYQIKILPLPPSFRF